jgi:hypothetical protein
MRENEMLKEMQKFNYKFWDLCRTNGIACIFAFSYIIEGTTEKVLQFYNRNFGFIEQKMYFWTLQTVSDKKNYFNWHHFFATKKYVDLFRAAPYMLVLVLHKDALLH